MLKSCKKLKGSFHLGPAKVYVQIPPKRSLALYWKAPVILPLFFYMSAPSSFPIMSLPVLTGDSEWARWHVRQRGSWSQVRKWEQHLQLPEEEKEKAQREKGEENKTAKERWWWGRRWGRRWGRWWKLKGSHLEKLYYALLAKRINE